MDSQLLDFDVTGITCIATPISDPIGTILIGFDDGTVRVWQSQMNENLKKIMQYQQQMSKNMSKAAPADVSGMMANKPPSYDISAFGY